MYFSVLINSHLIYYIIPHSEDCGFSLTLTLPVHSPRCCLNDFLRQICPTYNFNLGSHCHPETFRMAFSPVKCRWPFMVRSSYLFHLFCQHHKFESVFRHVSLLQVFSTFSVMPFPLHEAYFMYFFIWIFFLILETGIKLHQVISLLSLL